MERIEENAKIVVLLLEQLINKEINIEIERSLNDLKIYHVVILNLIIYEWNCYKALTLMEKIKCECGEYYTKKHKNRHEKSQLHQDIIMMNELD